MIPPLPPHSILGRYKIAAALENREIHSKVPKGSAAGRKGEGLASLRDLSPAGIWSAKTHRVTTLVEKSRPKARRTHGRGIPTPTTGPKAFTTSARAALLGPSASPVLPPGAARDEPLRGRYFAAGKDEDARARRGKAGHSRSLWPGCFDSLK